MNRRRKPRSVEPIVNTPTEAVKDFFGMGLDVLVLQDVVVEKGDSVT